MRPLKNRLRYLACSCDSRIFASDVVAHRIFTSTTNLTKGEVGFVSGNRRQRGHSPVRPKNIRPPPNIRLEDMFTPPGSLENRTRTLNALREVAYLRVLEQTHTLKNKSGLA